MWPLTVFVSPMPQSGGVRHSDPVAAPTCCPSASPSPMSCSRKSECGQMSWNFCALLGASRRVTNFGVWQRAAAS